MLMTYKRGQGSIVLRVKLLDSSATTGAGKTGLTSSSSGLIISTIADNEASATVYTQAGSTIESITTLGTFAAPTATKCRFKELDATNHPGIYEIQIADARYAVSNAKSILISISGVTNLAQTDLVVALTDTDPYDAVHGGMSALPNTACTTNASLLTSGTSTDQLSVTSGRIDIGKALGTAVTLDSNNVLNVSAKYLAGTALTGRDIGASVLLSSGAGTGQLDFTSGVVKANATQWLGGTIPAVNVTGVPLVDAKYLLGTIFSTPATAGVLDVNLKNIANAAVNTSSAQLGVNVVNFSGSAAPAQNVAGVPIVDPAYLNGGTIDPLATLASDYGSNTLNADLVGDVTGDVVGKVTGGGASAFVGVGVQADLQTIKTQTVTCAGGVTIPAATLASTTNITAGTITTVSGNVNGSVGSVTGNVGGNVTGSVGSIAAGGIIAASFAADAITAAKIADGALDAATFASGALDAVWSTAARTLTAATNITSNGGTISQTQLAHLDADISSRMATYTQPTGFLAASFPASLASPTNITAGTITTVTNVTNAPTAGDFTATMKTSLNAATPAVTVSDKSGFSLTSAYDPAKTASQAGDVMKVSAGTGAGQLDFTSGVVKANATQWLGGAIPAVNVTGVPLVDAGYLNGGTIDPLATFANDYDSDTLNANLNGSVTGDVVGKVLGGGASALVGVGVQADLQTIKTQTVTCAGGVTIPAATLASTTNITAGTITTATNLTNAPTTGDFTATMKTSLNSATPAVTVSDKTGFKLASDGLDSISITAPTGVATNFREMLVQLWRRFFRKATKTSTQIKTYADNGTTVVTTQTISDDGTTQTQGAGS
jgi:hypothetical protein